MSYVPQDATLAAVTVPQITDSTFSRNETRSRSAAAGASATSLYGLDKAEPMATFESTAIATILAGLPLTTGLAVAAGSIVIPFRQKTQGGTYASGSSHFTVTGANGLGVVTQIVARQGQRAVATVEFHFRSTDGVTDPTTENTSQSLSSGSFVSEFDMGPIVLNSTAIDEVESVTIRPGLTVRKQYSGGIFPTLLTIDTPFVPTIEVQCRDLDRAAANITTLVAYLRKKTDGGYVAAGTAQHISFSFGGGVTEVQSLGGQPDGDGTKTFRFHGDAFTVASTATIS